MRVTREEAESLQRKLVAVTPRGVVTLDPSLLAQAEVSAKLLVGDPHWTVYQQRLQALIDIDRTNLNGMADAMLPNMTSEQVLMAHRHMACAKARIEAWEQAMGLPKQIIDAAAKAPQTDDRAA